MMIAVITQSEDAWNLDILSPVFVAPHLVEMAISFSVLRNHSQTFVDTWAQFWMIMRCIECRL
jgi:hypothetical protein